jgi:hypothetical protein
MVRVADESLGPAAVEQWFGVRGATARAILLETPGTQIGVWLVEFTPPSDVLIRVGGVGVATDALKMIEFFTADRPAAMALLKAHGFEFVSEGASVDLPDGSRFVEAHVRAPDGVMFALAAAAASAVRSPSAIAAATAGPAAERARKRRLSMTRC